MPTQFLESVGGGSRAARIDPGRVGIRDERAERHPFAALDPVQRVVAEYLVAENLPASLSRFLQREALDIAENDSLAAPVTRVVGTIAAWLHPQGEAG
jgi:hypothetical protein